MSSVLTKNPIQHWIDTPIGSFEGYPTYGNMLHELFFENRQDVDAKLGYIINVIERQLGELVANTIQDISFLDDPQNDTFYILISLVDGVVIGEF
ncbi:MAG: hypothetical protein GQ474_09575 [Sulfurimonas sp.]|nr:hypothetical protein [Sulfurimonas sp.]